MSEIDFGLLLGSTNNEIWDEEVAKTAGGRALRKAMIPCGTKGCEKHPRQHFQDSFNDPDIARRATEQLEAHEAEDGPALKERLSQWAIENNIGVHGGSDLSSIFDRIMQNSPLGGRVVNGGVVTIGPDGAIIGGDNLPPGLRDMIQHLFSDDDPTAPPKGSSTH